MPDGATYESLLFFDQAGGQKPVQSEARGLTGLRARIRRGYCRASVVWKADGPADGLRCSSPKRGHRSGFHQADTAACGCRNRALEGLFIIISEPAKILMKPIV